MVGYLDEFARTGDPGDGGAGLVPWQEWSNVAGEPKAMLLDADLATANLAMTSDEISIAQTRMAIDALPGDPFAFPPEPDNIQGWVRFYMSLIQPFSLWLPGDYTTDPVCP